jgi:hypothetical protein
MATAEAKMKMRMAKLGKKRGPHSAATKLKMSLASKGRPKSTAHKESMSRYRKAHPKRYWLGKKRPNVAGENSATWKGDEVSYRNLHRWVERLLGKPNRCVFCGKIATGRRIHWANKSGEYRRILSDWLRLCSTCHGAYDKQNNFRKH